MIKQFLFFLLSVTTFFVFAQEPVSIHISEKDGLPDKEFYNIIEDSKGYIWLCADKGLFRYDGKTYKNYTNTQKKGLSVFGLKEDSKGQIWCNNISGQFFYVRANKLVLFIDLNEKLQGELATFQVTKKYLYVFSGKNIYKINLQTKKLKTLSNTKFSLLDTNKHDFIFSSEIIHKDDVYLSNSLSIFKVLKDTVADVKLEKTDLFLNNKIYKGNKFKLASVGTNILIKTVNLKELDKPFYYYYNPETQQINATETFKALKNTKIYNTFNEDNLLWFTTISGVWLFEKQNGDFKLKQVFLKDKSVTRVIKDKNDNYWFTTLNNGIYLMPNLYIQKYNFKTLDDNITAIDKVSDNELLIGCGNGKIGLLNVKSAKETPISLVVKDRVSAIKYIPEINKSVISYDNYGFILNHKNLNTSLTNHFRTIKSFSASHKDLLSVNYKYTVLNKNFILAETKKIEINKRAYATHYNKFNTSFYVAYVDDLVKFDDLFQQKQTITNNDKPILANKLTQTNDTVLWASTFKNGIYGFLNDSLVAHFSVKNGLVSNRIQQIKAKQNKLWIVTDAGIQVLNTENNTFKTLTKSDGVLTYNITGISFFRDNVLFASSEGLFSINETNAFKTQKPSNIYITKVVVNNNSFKRCASFSLIFFR